MIQWIKLWFIRISLIILVMIGFACYSLHPEYMHSLQRDYFFPSTNDQSSTVPLNIFQTWYTKDLPPSIQESVTAIQEMNPEFQHYLFDDNECRTFIKENYHSDVYLAYETLVPGAYKADLWRYCILYKYGGIYLDVKFVPVNDFKLINLINDEHFCKDLPNPRAYKQGIYNAFMVCKPGNEILKQCILKCVENCQNQFYGSNSLEVTGPNMMVTLFDETELQKCEELYHTYKNGKYLIIYQEAPILMIHPNYRKEQNNKLYQKEDYVSYNELWTNKKVYNQMFYMNI